MHQINNMQQARFIHDANHIYYIYLNYLAEHIFV